MSKRFLSGINVTGSAALNTVADAGSNTDKFLVLDSSNVVSYRTAAELYADLGIGSTAAAYTSTLKHEVKASQTISKGQAVYVSSADGTNMIVSKASNVSEQYSSKTMGLLETSLSTNGKGNVITEGLLAGLNTNGATAGDPVWLGVDGALIFGLTNKPYAPAHLVFIGIVTRANSSNGEIFVKVQNGFEMRELHDYQEGSVQNNQVIVYESATSLYKPKTIPTILGYTPVPDSRTLTINGTTYDLTANRSWTITTDASARSILRYVATASQTTFTISGGYTPGLTDVYRNGVKLDNSTDFTATNGTTIVLTNGASVNDVIEVYRYQTAFLANNALRVVTEFIATAGQTVFNVTYNSGLVDVFYNGSKLVSSEFTAGNGTSITLAFACNLNDSIAVHAYSYAVGAFTGQAQLNGTGFVKVTGTTVSYDSSTYLTTASASSTYQTIITNPITGTGTTNYLPKFTGASTIGNSNITDTGSLITLGSNSYVNGNVGIGSTPSTNISLLVSRNITGGITSYGTYSNGTIQSDVTTNARYHATFIGTAAASFTVNNAYGHYVAGTTIGAGSAISTQQAYFVDSTFIGATNNYAFRSIIPSGTNRWNLYMDGTALNYLAGNLLIGSTTDNGIKLQVTGQGYFSNSVGIAQTSLTGYSLRITKNITGSTTSYAIRQDGIVQSDVTGDMIGIRNDSNTAVAAFTLTNYTNFWARQGTIGAGSAITNQYGYRVDSNMTGATNNYAFNGSIPSGTNRWNIYMDGTASNYMAGVLNIGTTTLAGYTLDVNGTGRFSGALSGTSATFSGLVTINSNIRGLAINRDAVTNYNGIGYQTAGVQQWFVGMRENLSSNNYIIYNENGTDALTISKSNSNVTAATDVTLSNGTLYVSAGSGASYTSRLSTGYNFPYIDTYLDSFAGTSYQGRLNFRTNSEGGAMSTKMTILNSGNVGIGTSSPTAYSGYTTLCIDNSTSGGVLQIMRAGTAIMNLSSLSSQGQIETLGATNLVFITNANERMRITSGGDVQLTGNTYLYAAATAGSATVSAGFRLEQSTNTLISYTNNTERMRITSGGNVLIGTTSDDARLTVQPSGSGYGQVINHTNAGSQFFISFRYNGSQIGTITGNNSNVAYNTSSDYRLKQDLKEFKGLDLVSAIKTYDYQWKIDESRMYGVIAHELAEVLPYAVQGEKDGKDMQGVDYSKIVPLLIKAIQEQQAQIEELKELIKNK